MFCLIKNLITIRKNQFYAYFTLSEFKKYEHDGMDFWNPQVTFNQEWGILMGPITLLYFIFSKRNKQWNKEF